MYKLQNQKALFVASRTVGAGYSLHAETAGEMGRPVIAYIC